MSTIRILALACAGLAAFSSPAMALSFSIGGKSDAPASPEKIQERATVLRLLKENVPPVAFEKLTPEQTERVLTQVVRSASKRESSAIAESVPVLAFLLFLASSILVPIHFRNRRFKDFQGTLQLMVEKGVTIPTELIENGMDGGRAVRDWRRGVFLLAIGGGLIACLVLAKSSAWGIGWIPIFLGGASVYLARTAKRQ